MSADVLFFLDTFCASYIQALPFHSALPYTVFVYDCMSSDIAHLEQDTVLGLESLLMLCSQDGSPSAQATLKVKQLIIQYK